MRCTPICAPLIDRARAVDLSVSFLMTSGVRLVLPHLRDLLDRGGELRLLTGDYLGVTEPAALRLISDLEGARRLHVFQAAQIPFHPKAWMFTFAGDGGALIVGSSNLSRSALTDGIEWNLRHVDPVDPAPASGRPRGLRGAARPARGHRADARLDRRLRGTSHRTPAHGQRRTDRSPGNRPHPRTRFRPRRWQPCARPGRRVMVLGWWFWPRALARHSSRLSTARMRPRILFVAHREEILTQAMAAFRAVRPRARLGRYSGEEKDAEADIVFASVQTLARNAHLTRFDPRAFDYIVVDEFHHAAAATYRRIIDHFQPGFLLGLTATPDRSDGGDLLGLCEENLVYECDLWSGIDRGAAGPLPLFRRARSGRVFPDPLAQRAVRRGRADRSRRNPGPRRKTRSSSLPSAAVKKTIGFCVSRRHADFMADFAQARGLRAVAVHSGDTSAPRASALKALEDGDLDIVFAVDMFNEGVDVPSIDTVLMLRPTESPVIWLQQLGRGLRRSAEKKRIWPSSTISATTGFS